MHPQIHNLTAQFDSCKLHFQSLRTWELFQFAPLLRGVSVEKRLQWSQPEMALLQVHVQCWLWAQFSWRKSVVLVIHCRTLTVHVPSFKPRPCFSFGKIFLYSFETKFRTESLCSRVTFIPIKHANLFLKCFVLSHSALILWTSMTN